MIDFDLKQFEHFFNETTLKKGLSIFEKGGIEVAERLPEFEYHFVIREKELYLEKKGDKLMSYSCSCSKKEYCEHLSAALFYFQQEALGIKIKNKKKKKPENRSLRISIKEENLRKTQVENLKQLIHEHGESLTDQKITAFLSDNLTLNLFDIYFAQLETVLEPYTHLKKLEQQSIDKIEKEILHFLNGERKRGKAKDPLLINLAVVCGFIPLFSLRYIGSETNLFKLYQEVLNALNLLYNKGLDKLQKQAWFKATLKSVEYNKSLHSETYTFMIPRFVNSTKSEKELFVLGDLLKRRTYKIPYTSQLDKLMMVRLEVALKEWKLFKTAFPLHYDGIEVELIFAKAELYFCNNKNKQAFKLLEEEYEKIRTAHKIYYNDYLNYILSNAERTGNSEIEIKYLRESFLRRLFIVRKDLERFMSLLPEHERENEITHLINLLKQNTNGYYFDKISLLLLQGNLLDELITELSRQNNKFQLMHEVALRKFPEYNTALLTLYMRHLIETLRQDSIYTYQMKVFTTAKEFLDKLPENVVIELIKKLLDQIGKTGHLYRYINELYDYPFLKEER